MWTELALAALLVLASSPAAAQLATQPSPRQPSATSPALPSQLPGLSASCKAVAACGKLVKADCGITPGGKVLYADLSDASRAKVVANCGTVVGKPGSNWHRQYCDEKCPPKDWTCPELPQ